MRAKHVAILESRLGGELAELVEKRGGIPFRAPALAELPDLDPAQIAALVRSLEERPAKLAVFQTGVGTRALFAATDALALSEKFLSLVAMMTVAVRGPKPAGALRARKVRIDRSAADPFTTRELLAAIEDVALEGERVIVQRHGSANLERGEIHAVLLTNAEQARNLFAVAAQLGRAEPLRAALNRTLVASIGPVASAALREAGVKVGLESSPPKLGALLSSVEAALSY